MNHESVGGSNSRATKCDDAVTNNMILQNGEVKRFTDGAICNPQPRLYKWHGIFRYLDI